MSNPALIYCKRQSQLLQQQRFALHYSQYALPLLALTLLLLSIIQWLYPIGRWPVLFIFPLLLLFSLYRVYQQGRWRLPHWKVAAFIDQQVNAQGRFMHAFETMTPHLYPEKLPPIRFPGLVPRSLQLAWVGLGSGLILWSVFPPIEKTPPIMPPTLAFTPQPIAHIEQQLQQLDPEKNAALTEQIQQFLAPLRQRPEGLTAEDFQALNRLQAYLQAQTPPSSSIETNPVQTLKHQLTTALQSATLLTPEQQQALNQAVQKLQKELPTSSSTPISPTLAQALTQLAQSLAQSPSAEENQPPDKAPGQPTTSAMIDQQRTLQKLQQHLQALDKIPPHKPPPAQALSPQQPGSTNHEAATAPLNFSSTAKTGQTDYRNQTFSASQGQAVIQLGQISHAMPEAPQVDTHGINTRLFTAHDSTPFSERRYRPQHLKVLQAYFNDFNGFNGFNDANPSAPP